MFNNIETIEEEENEFRNNKKDYHHMLGNFAININKNAVSSESSEQ